MDAGWWPQLVSSYALDDGARLILFDPLAVPEQLLKLAADREPVVVLSSVLGERSRMPPDDYAHR